MKNLYIGIAALLLVLGISAPASANLLTNGSFETGDLTGWTDGGNTGWNSVTTVPAPSEGVFGVSNGAVGSLSTLSQTITTSPGGVYHVDFWISNDGAGIFNVLFDGVTGYSEAFVGHGYELHGFNGIATGSSTVLQLQSQDDPGFLQFDGISVDQLSRGGNVPEPSTLALLGLGFAALAGLGKRRRKGSAA